MDGRDALNSNRKALTLTGYDTGCVNILWSRSCL